MCCVDTKQEQGVSSGLLQNNSVWGAETLGGEKPQLGDCYQEHPDPEPWCSLQIQTVSRCHTQGNSDPHRGTRSMTQSPH